MQTINNNGFFYNINWSLLALTLILFFLGVINLYSASSFFMEHGTTTSCFYKKQLIWGGLGLIGMFFCLSFDYRHLKNLFWTLYGLSIALLLWVWVWGTEICGAKRWISLEIISFQPTELVKLSILLLMGAMLSQTHEEIDWPNLLKFILILSIPTYLIIKQPDLGSGINILLIAFGMLFYKGMQKKVFLTLFLSIPILSPGCWFLLKDYQKERILTFLNPGQDPLGAGYNIIQSRIAIGSGQLWGKGFQEGTQSHLRFLPEKHTDFAFSVFGEEWGFVGCIILLILFCIFLYQIITVIQNSKDSFGSYLAVGIFFYFFWQILINMCMVLGIMPVVGIPLPFLSYGGTSTFINFCLLGLVLNISRRRFVFK